MSRKNLSGRVLAIQLTGGQLRIAKVSLGSAAPVIQTVFVSDLPEGAVIDGIIHQPDAVRSALKDALNTPGFQRCRRVVFSLCTSQILTETATLPQVPEHRLRKMLEANMDLYFPVNTQDYHLTWELIRHDRERGEILVRMWAVSTSLIQPYYRLANALGLSVAAIDHCGHSLASAVGACFGQTLTANTPFRTGQKGGPPPGQLSPVTDLYLLAEKEHLLTLFVRQGHVELERILLRGPDPEQALGEVLLVLDYYDSMNTGPHGDIHCHLCGALADDEPFLSLARAVLNLPVSILSTGYSSMWTLALGAVRTGLDFGVPALNLPGGQIHNPWQYGLVLAGGAVLALTLAATAGSMAVWNTTIGTLENTRQALQLQANQNAGFSRNYRAYEQAYENYAADWDAVHNALHTFNDNLPLVMEGLEAVLPQNTSVVDIQIADNGLVLTLASPTKEEAAFTIMSLRGLWYATLGDISDLVKSPNDSRYHYTVVLDYQDSLIQAGPGHKSLDHDAKVAKREVDT